MGYRDKLRDLVAERQIIDLLHFTPVANTESILTHGLAGRTLLDERKVPYLYTDPWRLDEHPEAVCLSIEEVNYAMLDAKRRDYHGAWVIFALDPSILWTHECRFCWHNGATREIRDHTGFIGGPWAFERMFESRPMSGIDPRCRREVYDLDDHTPTDNAAEVQVFDPIYPDLFTAAVVRYEHEKPEIEAVMERVGRVLPVEVIGEVFA